MRSLFVFVLSCVICTSAPTAVHAASDGKIVRYQLNSGVSGRGVCIQMTPSIPGTGWACLYKSNPLYSEINELLLAGFLQQKDCAVRFEGKDRARHDIITIVGCR